MAEHFNSLLYINDVISMEERGRIFSVLIDIYTPFFNYPHEVCLINYYDGTSVCESWVSDESLMKFNISDKELLFVYGDGLNGNGASRCSIHMDKNDRAAAFSISLPVSAEGDFFPERVEKYLLKMQEFAETLSRFFIISAGWELELDISAKKEKILENLFSELSLSQWVGVPKQFIHSWPSRFEKISESENSIMLKNIAI